MWDHRFITRIDYRLVFTVLCLMVAGLLVISATTQSGDTSIFYTNFVKGQLKWCALGWCAFYAAACFDYRKMRNWSWGLYAITVAGLLLLFFTTPIHGVRRWFRLPMLPFDVQPSEIAKISLVLVLSCFLEKNKNRARSFVTLFRGCALLAVPFLLILKQPDLGSALVLLPTALVIFYFGDVNKRAIVIMTSIGGIALALVVSIFLGGLSHDTFRTPATKVLKAYQYERLNPDTYHKRAAQTAIGVGHYTGSGWKQSDFTGKKWLPAAYTDSVFPAFVEEFGFFGGVVLLALLGVLVLLCFRVTLVARDDFGRMLSAGIAVYLAVHIVINLGMMCGMLPITGVPLMLVTYGGSSTLMTMAALGVVQSIYARRFMF